MEANRVRGNFSMGVIQLNNKRGHTTTKRRGEIDFDTFKYVDDYRYLIGHTQSPTSAKRTWEYDTSHPFQSGDWMIVHNGVLTNEPELRKAVNCDTVNAVDSSLISSLLMKVTKESGILTNDEQVKAIQLTLEALKGTFAVAIIYIPRNKVYIARQGSVLKYDNVGNFSSIGSLDWNTLEEGTIMRLIGKKWSKVGNFETKSPFVML